LSKFNKRYFLNLGAQNYESSTKWFIENYPTMNELDWEIHAFECDPKRRSGYEENPKIKLHQEAIGDSDGYQMLIGSGTMGRIIKSYGIFDILLAKYKKTVKVQTIDFVKWLKDNISKDDFVLIKMDIEGVEFKVLPRIIENSEYVNEMFIEFHYNRWMKPQKEIKDNWIKAGKPRYYNPPHKKLRHPHFKVTYSECHALLLKLREKNIYAHWWP
jgi:FkbM family methyltransferase